ncbi:DUF3857 domain-containing protein [Flavobacterium pedocola]
MKKIILSLLFVLISTFSFAQKADYQQLINTPELKENANSIVSESVTQVMVNSQKSVTVKNKKVILVLNEAGFKNVDAVVHYDKSVKVKNIEAKMFAISGRVLNSFRKDEFKDVSVADGVSIFTDNRMLYLDYTPTEYPFVIVFNCETESENTAMLPAWYPIDDLYESVVKSKYTIEYPENLGFHYKEQNLQGYAVVKQEQPNKLSFVLENSPALKTEEYALPFEKTVPNVSFALEKFNLEGVEGDTKNWRDFGKWISDNLLKGQDELPEATVSKIKSLVGSEQDNLKKAQIVYEYVQNKTRYVSVQLGIGGWKPMAAKEVDKLGYGDCKALSNYTMALLKAVDVPSYYTIIYAGSQPKDIDQDFVSLQGNHAILALPYQGKNYFLECTSQSAPFGFEGNFTDGRYALLVKPEGGEMVKTNTYENQLNSKITKAKYTIDAAGGLTAGVSMVSKGIQYNAVYPIQKLSHDKIVEHYKTELDVLKNPDIQKYAFQNDKKELSFKEELEVKSKTFADISGGRMIFPLNAFNQINTIPQRYRARKHMFQILRGFFDTEEYEITLPDNYAIEALPQDTEVTDVFGEYKVKIEKISASKILYKRTFLLKAGKYEKEHYEGFRKFKEQLAKLENSKIVLITK